jgi:hypothetical protein
MAKTENEHRLDARNQIIDAIYDIRELPASRELSIALTKLDEAEMWLERDSQLND